jgi:glycosyl transferase, family 25
MTDGKTTLPSVISLVINLDRSPTRLTKISAQLDFLGLRWHRIAAVDGATLDMDDPTVLDKPRFHEQHGKPPLPGELGCYLSHVKALETLLSSNYEWGLILEDDAVLGDALPSVINTLLEHPQAWDLVKLSGMHSGTPVKVKKLSSHRNLCIALTSYTGASCYLVNRRAAKCMSQRLLPMSLPYDWAYDRGWLLDLKVRIVLPAPCEHSFAMGSELHPKGVIRKNFPWHRRFKTYVWRLSNGIKRLSHGLSELITIN